MNRKNVEDLYPLSPLQQGMLFHTLYSPGSGAYLEQMVMTLEGPVHPEPFRRAWQKVIDRHPALRTGFVWEGVPQPLQVVFRQVELPFEFEDWRSLSASEQERRLAERMERERLDGLDLSRPHLRVRLYRTAADEHRFVLTTHHMLLDGWSLPILLGEFDALYGGFVRGQEPRLPARRPFREYIAWLNRQDAGAAEAFWRGRLAGFQAPTPLPLDLTPARAGTPAEGHARERVDFPAALAEALEQSARSFRVTPSGLLQCAWGAVLAAYAGESGVVFGATVSGRPPELPGVEEMVGMFINTVPVRIEVPWGTTVEAWVQAAHRDQAEARLYEHAQLAQVRTWSQVPPEGPLFETLLVYENYPLDALNDGGGAEFDASAADEVDEGFHITAATSPERTNYPLALVAAPSPVEFRLSATYDPARLSGASVRALLDGLGRVLGQIIADPAGPVEALTPFGSDAVGRTEEGSEPARLLRLGEGPSPEIPPSPIHRLFEAQAAARPDAAALVNDDGGVTYAELNARANRLARRLRELGVGVESRVGVSMDRSPELTVTVLAILKAGAASVPLDPLYPAERLALMRRDAGVTLVVTDGTGDSEDGDPSIPILSLAAEKERIAALSGEDLDDVEVDPENLAYVLFTSGSTGTPKGVGIPHRAAVRLVRGQTYAHLGPDTVFLQLAPAAFDAAVLEVWAALLNGGTVAIHPPFLPEPAELGAFLTRHGVTTAWITAGLFHQLVDAGAPGLGGLRQVISGGEVLSPSHVRRAMELLPRTWLTNGYGPTESTTFTLTHAIRADDLDGGALPIGLPIANTRAYVLDARMRAVPAGVPGELFVGGLGLARGYVGRPGMTAERFVPDPFTSGQRLYRTGDRVRWSTAGEVEFLGRIDRQVKLRGFRIEPGEIETALLAHPSVRAAVVDVREGPGGRRLVAWVVSVDDGAPDAADLRGHLSRTLPDYMLPAAFVAVDAIPLTAHGKVDRAALPDPGAPESSAYVAPRTATETRLAEIWVEVLKLERVGGDDNFFVLGGHSLLATQIVSRARAAFGVELPLRTLFEHPTLEGLAAAIDALKSGAEAGKDGTDAPDASAIVPVPRAGELPTALQQERLWFIDRMDPGTSGYTIAAALELTGALDAAALGRALGEIVRRHEALRTVFAEVAGHPVQRVQPAGEWAMAVEDLSADGPRAAGRRAEDRIREEAARPFDLARGPLFRATLLRLDEDSHALLITVHHVVFDGWSMGVFMRELSALYASFRQSLSSPLAALPVQYGDYAAWQRSEAAGTDRQLEWWRAHLDGAPHVLDLPTDRPRPAARTMRGGHVDVSLDASVLRRVKAVAHAEGATPFMVLLAAWQLLLARYAGTDDVLVGSPIAGRSRQETEGLIGFFVNTLVLRGRVRAGQAFQALLAAVRDEVLGAFAHQDVPFERLVDALKVERDLARTPLYQAMFTLQNDDGGGAPSLDGLKVEGLGVPFETARTDLSLSLHESADGLHGTLEFSADVFTRETAERIVAHYATLLNAALLAPARAVDDLPLAEDGEDARLLRLGEGPSPELPPLSIHRLYESLAAAHPDAVALVDDGGRVTYAELNARANRLARRLRELGVAPEDRVGVAMERAPELVVALLAILKSGGACVPLDPAYPAERRAFMRLDAGVRVVVSNDRDAGDGDPSIRVLSLADEGERIAALPDGDLADGFSDPEALAYVLYTSGSTGTPKAAALPHRTVVRLVREQEYVRFSAGDVVLQLATISFDASLFEVWGALLNGGALAVHPPYVPAPAELGDFATRHGVTVAVLTTGLFHQVVDAGAPGLGGIRQLATGGEVLSPVRALAALELLPHTRLVNGYGPTESTTFAVCHPVRREDAGVGSIPIGRPLANTRAYLLDGRMRPVPIGVPGELYLGGAGLARGYLGRAGLTAERFVPDPFNLGARLYRTGDRARWNARGEVEFLGRMDRQVKLRGFRIEPGEIEAALLAHPSVRAAVVAVRDDGPVGRRLVAWTVPADGGGIDAAELRAQLARTLPEYMVPSALVEVAAIPLTANGKVDRAALPAPEAAVGTAPSRPMTETETAVAAIWAELLDAREVGPDDGFFELGGHSLLAAQVVGRIRAVFGTELPLRALFEASRLEDLAARIDAAAGQSSPAAADPIVPLDREGPLPVSFSQERLWFLQQRDPASALYNMPTPTRFRGPLDAATMQRAITEIARRHEPLRTLFALEDGPPVQRILPPEEVPLPVHRLDHLPEAERVEEARKLVNADVAAPFDLTRGRLLRAMLVRLAADDHLLLVNFHHMVSDGWSVGVFMRELRVLYEAFRAGQPSPLPELPVQFADFAAWQRAWLTPERAGEQLAWWAGQLAGAPAALELPTDRPRAAVQRHRGEYRSFLLPPDDHARVRALAVRSGATLAMTVLAAFQLLLGRLAGQDDVVVGTPIAGRTRPETEGMIGFFLNILAIRTRLGNEETFAGLLRAVRETMLGAYAHQNLPFDRVLDSLSPERTPSRNPVYQVLFNMLNLEGAHAGAQAEMEELENAELVPGPWEAEMELGAKYDLTIYVQELDEGLIFNASYDADLFHAERIAGMMRQLFGVLRQVAADPSLRLDALSLLTEEELEVAALPDAGHATAQPYVAPRTAAEQVLAEIWGEVLGRERVGAQDNFFALGGHAVAAQVLSRVEQTFGVKLPASALVEQPTVAALAARLEASGEGTLAEAMAELDALSEEELMALLGETEEAEGIERREPKR